MSAKLRAIKLISRFALGLVWLYEGLVPKILFLRGRNRPRASVSSVANTRVHFANSRRRADARRLLADDRICRENCRLSRDRGHVDPDCIGGEWESVDLT